MISSFIVGKVIVQEGYAPDQKLVAGSAQAFLIRFYDDTEYGRRTYIKYVRRKERALLLTGEQEERIIDDMRFSTPVHISAVCGGNTVRVFSAVDGSRQYSYVYAGSEDICHIIMPQENQIILQIKLSEGIVTKRTYRPSEWELLYFDMDCDRLQTIYKYETCQAFDTSANETMTVYDDYQAKCMIYSDK